MLFYCGKIRPQSRPSSRSPTPVDLLAGMHPTRWGTPTRTSPPQRASSASASAWPWPCALAGPVSWGGRKGDRDLEDARHGGGARTRSTRPQARADIVGGIVVEEIILLLLSPNPLPLLLPPARAIAGATRPPAIHSGVVVLIREPPKPMGGLCRGRGEGRKSKSAVLIS